MEITTRESQLLATIDYKDGCTKTIWIWKVYKDDTKTPVQRFKTVEFKNPDGTIDEDRADSSKLIIDKSDKFKNKYIFRKVEMLITINYNDGCTKTIHIYKVNMNNKKRPVYRYRENKFRYPDGKIDEKRSEYNRTLPDKSDESDFEDESPDVK